MLSPYAWIAAIVGAITLALGAFSFGVRYESGQHAKAELLVAAVREQAQLGAADAIAKNKPVQQIIKQQLETITREVPVYTDCRNTADAMRLLNDALSNRQPADRGELPGADTAQR